MREARASVQAAKVELGERGKVWWDDGAPDYNRQLVRNTPYAAWFEKNQTRGDSFHGLREPGDSRIVVAVETNRENPMAAKKKSKKTAKKAKTTRGRAQDRARVAAGQKYEVAYEAKKTGKKPSAVRKAVKKAGNSRKKVNKALGSR
jgi:hypothetical protein